MIRVTFSVLKHDLKHIKLPKRVKWTLIKTKITSKELLTRLRITYHNILK